MDGLGGVLQQVQQYLFQFVGSARHRTQFRVELPHDGLPLEVETDRQVEVVAGNFHRLVDQRRQLARLQLSVAAAAEAEHVGDDLRRAGPGLLDAIEQLRHFAAGQVAVDHGQVEAKLAGLFLVAGQVCRQASADVLYVVQDGAQRVVDFVSHARRQAADREHFFRLDHHFFQRQALGDVVDADHHAAPAAAGERVEGEGVMAQLVALGPGDPLDLGHPVLFHGFLQLRQERLQRLEGDEHRLVQRLMQRRAGEDRGFVIPLGDIELFVQGDQCRRHRVDDTVEVVLETGEFFLDLAAHLHFQFQLAVGMAGFLGQTLGLVIGILELVTGAFELLLTGLDARKHGVEGVGQAADLIVVATPGAQGVALFAGDLAAEFFKLVDRLGDQAFDLAGDEDPQQDAEHQDSQAGTERAGVERGGQLAAGHQQQVGRRVGLARDADQLGAAKLHQAPAVDVAKALGQGQRVAMLELRQHATVPPVHGCRAQRGVAVQLLEQGTGGVWGVASALGQLRVGHQPADGLQGLGCHALLGDPVSRADEGEVGHQQDGHQQYQQGRQQLLPDREVFQAMAQGHGLGSVRIQVIGLRQSQGKPRKRRCSTRRCSRCSSCGSCRPCRAATRQAWPSR